MDASIKQPRDELNLKESLHYFQVYLEKKPKSHLRLFKIDWHSYTLIEH